MRDRSMFRPVAVGLPLALVLVLLWAASGCGPASASANAASPSSAAAVQAPAAASAAAAVPAASVPLLAVVVPAQQGPCVVTTEYQHGSKVVFRVKVFDPTTGQQLTNKDLSAVSVVLPDGTKLPATFGTHEGGKIPFWTAKWTVPATYPNGQVNYTIAAQGTSRQIEQVKFDVTDPEAYLTVLKGTATNKGA